ncbi:MAG: extracellular solute-binding protein [Planctomycetota bacterium]
MWVFARTHARIYSEFASAWNPPLEQRSSETVTVYTIEGTALQRRMLSGFWTGTPLPDMAEIEVSSFSKYVTGPLDSVGFVDLTDRLHAEGIYDQIVEASFSPWTSRGRIFGLPHDVHPVLMVYRADIVEDELGIDVNDIETWDDFARVMSAVFKDLDGDGWIDRYPLSFWYDDPDVVEMLMLQAGGGTFNADDEIIVASETNARVLATVVHWCFGPGRIALDAPEFNAGGNLLKIEGRVVCALMPDWLAGIWKNDMPQLGGKLKLMPLPAWEPGGRRTSVRGGTMLGFPKASQLAGRFEEAWAFGKALYLSTEGARELFEGSNIISPDMSLWDQSFYHEPDPYFSYQPSGSLFIEQAPHVPSRTNHPFRTIARSEIGQAADELRDYAESVDDFTIETLLPVARRLLEEAQDRVLGEMSRNVFLRDALTPATESGSDR